mmetsp:Transcript_11619/g.22594  ORF Transcript_11619/g.22594 Transcript_11619/m.22594 type:complete len:99 (-) Transcript_11619:126-422(-)
MTTRLLYVYEGAALFGASRARIEAGTVARLSGDGSALHVEALPDQSCGFLFIAGAPIGEPVVQHGPFVMCNQQQIMQCFSDFQSGRLCPKPASHVLYE